ncbi:MAG: hypothetical protein QXZ67_03945 [Thermoplasmata archaeon]
MEEMGPYILYFSKRFMDTASKKFGLGILVRKPLPELFKKMNIMVIELDRNQAKAALEKLSESKNISVSMGQLIKNLTIAFFVPTGIVYAFLKKVNYRSGIETDDAIILEFLAEIPRAFRPTLFYDIWIVIPKSEEGQSKTKNLIKNIVNRSGVEPINEDEWENLKQIVEKFVKSLEVRGSSENLWKSF